MGLEKINEMRKAKGISVDELCELSGIPKGTLSKITAGITKKPSVETVKAIVHAMGYTLDDLDRDIKIPPVDLSGQPGEDDVLGIYDYLNQGLISLGLISADEDITVQQAEILISVSRILRAAFDE